MTDDVKEKLKQHIQNWKETEKVLERLRREEIRKTVTSEVLPVFDRVFKSARYLCKPRVSSGFVKMYQILEKSR